MTSRISRKCSPKGQTAKLAGDHVPRKGKRAHGGGTNKGNPKKGRADKFCKWCKGVDGPFTTHNTTECCRFNKDDGSQKDRLTKPFNSTKKPWKKPGNGNSDQISHLTEEMTKLKKRLNSLTAMVAYLRPLFFRASC